MKLTITIIIIMISGAFLQAQTVNHNYIKTQSIKIDSVFDENDISGLEIDEKQVSINYFDGLGRSSQNIVVAGSPIGRDIVQPVVYDDMGRQTLIYMPFTIAANNGSYIPDAVNESVTFNETENCYTETLFDNSPLNRVTEQIPQGDVSKNNSISVKISYLTNTAGEVIKWEVEDDNCMNIGDFPASSLYITETEDENEHFNREYKNGMGQVILTSSKLGSQWLKTYYIYDDFGLLRFVIPPKASQEIESGSSFESVKDIFCYVYAYDAKKRMIIKKLPGADSVFMVYDKRDLLVLTQDGNLRSDSNWLFTKYDAFKRPVITGKYHNITIIGQENMQNEINNFYGPHANPWEIYEISNHAYTNAAFPNTDNDCIIFSETYYDSHDYLQNNSEYIYTDVYNVQNSNKLKGMITVSKTKILNNNEMPEYLLTVNHYDKYGRVIQTIADNHLQGKDIISNKYNFAGELLESKHVHNISGSENVTIEKRFTYDHAGRLLTSKEKINNEDWQKINALSYNERSELKTKNIHAYTVSGPFSREDFRQTINYQYNIRGWLTHINRPPYINEDEDYFAMELKYETGENPQYNGNISAINWGSDNFSTVKTYDFTYDDINRLKIADYNVNQDYDVFCSYDYNGNILNLKRYGLKEDDTFGEIDDMVYSYTGNQLNKVDDSQLGSRQENKFSDKGANIPEQPEYFYDSNGNLTRDDNKQIDNITYNHLNLPEEIEIISNGTKYIYYTYDAAGIKLRKKAGSTITDYAGSFVYNEDNELKYIITDYGRIIYVSATGAFIRNYNLSDHLGNVRVTFKANGDVLQEDSYYPFGLTMNGLDYINEDLIDIEDKNKYLYNGKELQEDFELDWYDYGARFYDAQLGRWHVVDPMAETYYSQSSYHFSGNNPIRFIDDNGMNYDDYGVDKNGNIELIKKTKDKYDVLYAAKSDKSGNAVRDGDGKMIKEDTNNEGGVTESDGVTVKKNVLNNIAHKDFIETTYEFDGRITDKTTRTQSYMWFLGDEQGNELFEFLGDNTQVEWAHSKLFNTEGENGFNVISTTHQEGTVPGVYVEEYLTKNKVNYREHNHNHPSNNPNTSRGDRGHKDIIQRLSPKCKFNVYTKQVKNGKNYHPY